MPEALPRLALLAGGLATRLGALTQSIPKSLLPVCGEPFLAHQLRLLAAHGVREVVLCIGHQGEQVRSFAGDGSRFGCRIFYSHDGDAPLGTGGALRRALPLLGEEFFVLYGDSYLTAGFAAAWNDFLYSGKPALMTIFRNEGRWDASNVEVREGRIVRYSKSCRTDGMQYIDYGLNILRAEVLQAWPEGACFDLEEVMGRLAAQGLLAAHEVDGRFYEIGSFEGLRMTEEYLARNLLSPGVAG
ncbi:MAG: nucleotidyltransferase family protein [Bacillota bacterium]|nr:nucleotidyltransferase family protein [Bacillota bacterium]